ncbi:unnamed protein product, partial [marine sediment metagenome]
MDIFLDTADVKAILKYNNLGVLTGVTTNPTLLKHAGFSSDIEMIKEIREVFQKGEIHVEAFGESSNEIIENAKRIKNKSGDANLVFKIPFSEEGICACNTLKDYKTNMHLIFSHNQALLAASVKSDYICPLVGRLDDSGHDALLFVQEIVNTFKIHRLSPKVMVSSIRHPMHVIKSYKAGADAVTIPVNV